MKLLNPCNDWAFKRIFGSPESRDVLLCFLNDLLHAGRRCIGVQNIRGRPSLSSLTTET